MRTEDRIEGALARVAVVQERATLARLAGPPCSQCRHVSSRMAGYPKKPEAVCAHLAYANWAYDPASGSSVETHETPATEARSEEGLCGPEATLFEGKWSQRMIAARATGVVAGKVGAFVLGSFLAWELVFSIVRHHL